MSYALASAYLEHFAAQLKAHIPPRQLAQIHAFSDQLAPHYRKLSPYVVRTQPYINDLKPWFGAVAQLVLGWWILHTVLLGGWRHLRARGLYQSLLEPVIAIQTYFVSLFLAAPFVRSKVASELDEVHHTLSSKLAPIEYPHGITRVRSLPEKGRDKAWLTKEWDGLKKLEKGDVSDGRVSGAVYHGGEDLTAIINESMARFTVSNPLHPDVFPGVRKMEAEIVSMCLDIFNGPKGAGTTTSGGTESILMSVKCHRDWARETKGITKPEMVIPSSAHAAFWKASEYFGVKLHVIPVDTTTRKAVVRRIARAINPNTIMIVGSAPNFPDGAVDPIPALGKLARRHNIGLHVDCCLGSFIMPFLKNAGLADGVDAFDFSVPGVTAISCDIHKYAFCPKGSSVIMYHSPALRRYQYYIITDWAGGVYASPSMAGSRPGAILAGAWAVMNYVGVDGYTNSCAEIVSAARLFTQEIRHRFPTDLYILGDPLVSVVAFSSKTLSIYAVGDKMSKRGWHLNALQNPPALHMAFTRLTARNVDALLNDLKAVVEEVKNTEQASGGKKADGDMVALYGMGQTSVGPFVVAKAAEMFLDVLYE